MRFKEYLIERFYSGKPLEKGGTSIAGKAAPPVRDLFKKKIVKPEDKVLDYGAGKYSRNADFLRDQGCQVYAYDPFNGTGSGGWERGEVSNKLPIGEKFDVGFSAYVLNVVPEHTEDELIKDMRRFCKTEIHITRNKDIFESVKKALSRHDKVIGTFFIQEFAENEDDITNYENKTLSDKRIMDFCLFGYQSSRGFQRIPNLEDKGFKLIRNTTGYKVYKR